MLIVDGASVIDEKKANLADWHFRVGIGDHYHGDDEGDNEDGNGQG